MAQVLTPDSAPGYIPGKATVLALIVLQLFVCFGLRYVNIRLNREKAKAIEQEKEAHGWSDEDVVREKERHAFLDLTDKQYVL